MGVSPAGVFSPAFRSGMSLLSGITAVPVLVNRQNEGPVQLGNRNVINLKATEKMCRDFCLLELDYDNVNRTPTGKARQTIKELHGLCCPQLDGYRSKVRDPELVCD